MRARATEGVIVAHRGCEYGGTISGGFTNLGCFGTMHPKYVGLSEFAAERMPGTGQFLSETGTDGTASAG